MKRKKTPQTKVYKPNIPDEDYTIRNLVVELTEKTGRNAEHLNRQALKIGLTSIKTSVEIGNQ